VDAPVKESGKTDGKLSEVVGDTEGTLDDQGSAPIGFGSVTKVFSQGYAYIRDKVYGLYTKFTEVAQKLSDLASAGVEVLGTTVDKISKSIVDVGSWIKQWWSGDPEKAEEALEKSEDLSQVKNIEKFSLFTPRWHAYEEFMGFGDFGDPMMGFHQRPRMGGMYGRDFPTVQQPFVRPKPRVKTSHLGVPKTTFPRLSQVSSAPKFGKGSFMPKDPSFHSPFEF
jgi:hypothetical protein